MHYSTNGDVRKEEPAYPIIRRSILSEPLVWFIGHDATLEFYFLWNRSTTPGTSLLP